jgi:hypothetical protein
MINPFKSGMTEMRILRGFGLAVCRAKDASTMTIYAVSYANS